jgi:hypothetical protein
VHGSFAKTKLKSFLMFGFPKRRLRVHIIRIEIVLYFTFVLLKVQNPDSKPGNNVLLFPGFVLSKVQKDNNIFNNIVDVRRTRIVLFVLFAIIGV